MQTIINATIRIADFFHLYSLAARLAARSYEREMAEARKVDTNDCRITIESRRGGVG